MEKSSLLAWWRFFRTAALVVGLLLSFIAVVEVLHVYLILREFSPWLGIAFVVLLVGGSLWLLVRFFKAFWSLPRAPAPPRVVDAANLTSDELKGCSQFLQHRLLQVRSNPILSSADRDLLGAALARLQATAPDSPTAELIADTQASLANVLAPIDEHAERLVQDGVRDVMLAVVLSAYRSADLLVVVYRNGRMILQIAQLYQTRPMPIEQLRILKDVLAVVATVNFLNFTEKFIEQLLERIPLLGQVAGDVTQGVGAGLLTSATGHAAIARCKALGDWNRPDAQRQLAQRMSFFTRDVKMIFQADVLPKLKLRLPNLTIVSEKVAAAFDGAADGMSNWIWRPVSRRSSALAAATFRSSNAAWSGLRSGTQSLGGRGRTIAAEGKISLNKVSDRAVRAWGAIGAATRKQRVRMGKLRRKNLKDGSRDSANG